MVESRPDGAGPPTYNRREIRRLLAEGLTDQAFHDLCSDYFPAVAIQFTTGQTRGHRIELLLEWVRTRGQIEILLALLKAENPERYGQVEPLLRSMPAGLPAATAAPAREELERVVRRGLPWADVVRWRDEMLRAERCVCRIERPGGQGWGTGFLIGDDLVMTCYHVVQEAVGVEALAVGGDCATAPPHDLVARFDFKIGHDGVSLEGSRPCRLAGGTAWRVAISPSGATELDYIVLRLSETPGKDEVEVRSGDSRVREQRGFLSPASAHTFCVGEPLQILQHPKTEPMKYAAGDMVRTSDTAPRIFHTINTEGGSSGSPCFTFDWKLVALHQGSEEDMNRAIPVPAIVADWVAQSVEELIPAEVTHG